MQRRQDLGQTSSPAIEVSQRGGIFGRRGQPVGSKGPQGDPVVAVCANESAQS